MNVRHRIKKVGLVSARRAMRLCGVAVLASVLSATPVVAIPASAGTYPPAWHVYKTYQLTDSISHNNAVNTQCNTDGRAWERAYYSNPTYTHYNCAATGPTLYLRVYF